MPPSASISISRGSIASPTPAALRTASLATQVRSSDPLRAPGAAGRRAASAGVSTWLQSRPADHVAVAALDVDSDVDPMRQGQERGPSRSRDGETQVDSRTAEVRLATAVTPELDLAGRDPEHRSESPVTEKPGSSLR